MSMMNERGRSSGQPPAIRTERESAHILVLDDAWTADHKMAVKLRELGYQVTVCNTPDEALAVMQRSAIDLFVIDGNIERDKSRAERSWRRESLAGQFIDKYILASHRFVRLTGRTDLIDRAQWGERVLGNESELPELLTELFPLKRSATPGQEGSLPARAPAEG